MNQIITAEELKVKFSEFARKSQSGLSIITGAGASLGYSRKNNFFYRPPSVSQLFSDSVPFVQQILGKKEHEDVYSQRAHIQRSISKTFNGDLEAYLSDIYQNDAADNIFSGVLLYLEDIFTTASENVDLDDNHYQALLSRVRELRGQKSWSVITFNYDTLLEQSIAQIPRFVPKRAFGKDSDYIDINPKVLKMHGGVNLRYISIQEPNQDPQSPHEVFTEMMGDTNPVQNYLEIRGLGLPVPAFIGDRTYKEVGGRIVCNFPLMMIPIHTAVKCANSFFGRQIQHAVDEISKSGLVVAIGYQFGDNAFIDALKNTNLNESQLILVGSDQLVRETLNSRMYKEALKAWPAENIFIFGDAGFGRFIEALY